MKRSIIAGLDLGTTKVCIAVAERLEDGTLRVLGFGRAPSEGLTKGLVVSIPRTAEAIKLAVQRAETRIGVKIKEVNVGVAGEHITSMRYRNYVTIVNEEHEITKNDIERLRLDLRTLSLPEGRQILHIIHEEFFVDNQGGIENPIGLSGTKLEAANHIVLASTPAIQNIKKSVERAGLTVCNYVLQPIASSESVLDENERDLGVLLIDIGGGTTDIAVIHKKSIKHTKVFGVAGNQVTNDIREALGIVSEEAEQLKKRYGYASDKSIIQDEEITIKGFGANPDTKIHIGLLTSIINARMKELFEIVENDIRTSGYKSKIRAGIVLTGGGSLLNGCTDLVTEVFSIPAKIGVPLESITGTMNEMSKPEYATAVGLLCTSPESKKNTSKGSKNSNSDTPKTEGEGKLRKIARSVQDFFENL